MEQIHNQMMLVYNVKWLMYRTKTSSKQSVFNSEQVPNDEGKARQLLTTTRSVGVCVLAGCVTVIMRVCLFVCISLYTSGHSISSS